MSAVLVIVLTNIFNYSLASRVLLDRTASYTQESVEQVSAKIDVLLKQYDQFSQLIAFDSNVMKALSAPGKNGPSPDAVPLNRYIAEKVRYIASDMLIQLFDRE